jgi:hypothetical protein
MKNYTIIPILKRRTKKPKSNRYSEGYKPDLEYIIDNIDNTQNYAEYLAENMDEIMEKAQEYSEYLAENLDKTVGYTEYIAESLSVTIDSGHSNIDRNNRRGFRIISKGKDYIMLDSDSPSSHWISKDDTLIDSDDYVYKILDYNLTGYNLYLRLDGHLKLKEGELIYVNFNKEL